jgi:hypothetical protein
MEPDTNTRPANMRVYSSTFEYILPPAMPPVKKKIIMVSISFIEEMSLFFCSCVVKLYRGHEVDLAKADAKYIVANLTIIKEQLDDEANYYEDDYNVLMGIHQFMNEYIHYLPNCPQSVRDIIQSVQKKQKADFAKLNILQPVFKREG